MVFVLASLAGLMLFYSAVLLEYALDQRRADLAIGETGNLLDAEVN